MVLDLPALGKGHTIRNCVIVTVTVLEIFLASGKVGADKAEARVVEIKADPHTALVPCHSG